MRADVTDAEYQALLGATSETAWTGVRDAAIIVFLYRTGMRVRPVLDLRWAHLDFSAFWETDYQYPAIVMGSGVPLSPYSMRDFWLPSERRFRLSSGDAHRVQDWALRSDVGDEGAFFFRTFRGKPIDPANLRQMLARTSARAQINPVNAQDLRRSYVLRRLRANVRKRELQIELGHASVGSTQRLVRSIVKRSKA
jgi:integrase